MLFREIARVYCGHLKTINTLCEENTVLNLKTDGTYSYHCVEGDCH
jgi:hypothetical protein